MGGGGAPGLLPLGVGVFGCWWQGEGVGEGSGPRVVPYLPGTQNKQNTNRRGKRKLQKCGYSVIPIATGHAFSTLPATHSGSHQMQNP